MERRGGEEYHIRTGVISANATRLARGFGARNPCFNCYSVAYERIKRKYMHAIFSAQSNERSTKEKRTSFPLCNAFTDFDYLPSRFMSRAALRSS